MHTIRNVSYLNDEAVSRGRPRDAQLDRRLTSAVLEVLGEQGFEGLTFEAVARRSKASKASLYRRWPTKRDMVLAAVKEGPARKTAEPLEPGSCLRDDLLVLVRRLAQTMSAADAGTALMLLQAGLEDPDLCDAIEEAVGPTGARLPQPVIDAAEARGELPAGVDPFAYEEVVGAVLLLRRANGLAITDDYVQSLVDAVIIPALTASPAHAGLPAGIFSGHPAPTTAIPSPQETS